MCFNCTHRAQEQAGKASCTLGLPLPGGATCFQFEPHKIYLINARNMKKGERTSTGKRTPWRDFCLTGMVLP